MIPGRLPSLCALALLSAAGAAPPPDTAALQPAFQEHVQPFLKQNCVRCHNVDSAIAGVKVDQLDSALEDRHIKLWESVRHRVKDGTMPPKGMPQPTPADRERIVAWIDQALQIARMRPTPKNGLVRRLTVAQYRNTLRELLLLDDDLIEALPPDAVSKDGFVNNKETLQLSPLLLEAYLEIAEEALNRAIVDPAAKPTVQNFRMDLGAGVNPAPLKEDLILGANSLLLDNKDFTVTQLTPAKPFAFDPFFMRTKYRFIEGYKGNATVRGWRDFDSIYHSVFACMRGSGGYPKGKAYSTVPEGLLLRPAIPNDELFMEDGTYGPKANFKISLRELPDHGRFRVTVTAAKYDDGLVLDPGIPPQPAPAITAHAPETVTIPAPGVYQVDVYVAQHRTTPPPPDASRLSDALAGPWLGDLTAPTEYDPFGPGTTLPQTEAMKVGAGDFTLAAWIHPRNLKKATILSRRTAEWPHGWSLEIPDNRGVLRLETHEPDNETNGAVASTPGALRAGVWQHVAAVVRRTGETRLYVNGFPVARGDIRGADLDNPKADLVLARDFRGRMADARLYRRALSENELQALVEPGRRYATPPGEKPQDVTVTLGARHFTATLTQPAFVAVRLPAGPLDIRATHTGVRGIERIALTPLAATHAIARNFAAFEKRVPRLGVHLGLRRDCGSTFAPVGPPQPIPGTKLAKYVFEGAIRNFPSPDVEKDNVNYLAGIREIAVRSEFTDGRDMPRLLIRSVEFEGPFYDAWPPRTHTNLFGKWGRLQPAADFSPPAREVIRNFATRAYRRPVTATEEAALMAVYQRSTASGRNFRDAVKDALQVVLTSPQFLFLIETSSTPGPEPLDGYELASKLSYFLWNGPPDRTLLDLAAAGTLRARLNIEVARMAAHPRFSRFTREFVSQWLALDKIAVLEPDRKRFPALSRDARTWLREEPIHYVEHLFRRNLPAAHLIESDYIVANEAVASYYDLGHMTESGFRFVALPHGRRELGGVLSQAALMAGLSDGRESNPIKRGAWLARKIVAEPPNDPPPNVPAVKEDPNLSLRERLEQHRDQPGCRQCHTAIDPWGIALEEFDANGRLKRDKADASSTLPDKTPVAGFDDLRRYLAQQRLDQVAFSVLKHLTIYGTGRALSHNETAQLRQAATKLSPYGMQDLLRYVVTSPIFLEK